MLQRREPQRRDGCVAVDPCRTVTVPRGHPLAMRVIRVVAVLGLLELRYPRVSKEKLKELAAAKQVLLGGKE